MTRTPQSACREKGRRWRRRQRSTPETRFAGPGWHRQYSVTLGTLADRQPTCESVRRFDQRCLEPPHPRRTAGATPTQHWAHARPTLQRKPIQHRRKAPATSAHGPYFDWNVIVGPTLSADSDGGMRFTLRIASYIVTRDEQSPCLHHHMSTIVTTCAIGAKPTSSYR